VPFHEYIIKNNLLGAIHPVARIALHCKKKAGLGYTANPDPFFPEMNPDVNTPRTASEVPRSAMESLARELSVPIEQVEKACRRQAEALEADARIKSFVPVLVTSRVRSELRRRQRGT